MLFKGYPEIWPEEDGVLHVAVGNDVHRYSKRSGVNVTSLELKTDGRELMFRVAQAIPSLPMSAGKSHARRQRRHLLWTSSVRMRPEDEALRRPCVEEGYPPVALSGCESAVDGHASR